jgi:hypothetical protein
MATMATMPTCEGRYQVLGAIYDGEETESIDNVVFTDHDPFECEMVSATQSVNFIFNTTSIDSVTGCSYTIVRKHKTTGATLSTTETLECGDRTRHYEVIATPQTSDPDCSGLPIIYVDPKINITHSPGTVTC